MKKYLFLFVIGILFGLISCRINCPEFDRKILSWIPYQENDVIELYSQSNDSTILFSITSISVTHTTHYARNSKCGGCSDEIFINHYDSDFHFEMYGGGQSYKIFNTYFTTYSELNNYLFDGKEYDVVRIFENNNSNVSFKKLIIAKEFGIIGLIDKDGNTWALKTNDKGGNLKLMINNTSC